MNKMQTDLEQNEEGFLDDEDEVSLFEHNRIVVDKGQALLRIDKFLPIKLGKASRNKYQTAIEAGFITVNNKVVKPNYKVKPNDLIIVSLPKPPRNEEVIPENIPLNIIYEDEDLLIVNKAPGMVVHPAFNNWNGTLVNALVYHFNHLPNNQGERPGLVHRIDKDTSGLLVIAKTEEALTFLAKQFFEHTIERTYYALVWGVPSSDKGTIRVNIARSLRDRKLMDAFPNQDVGKHAVTHFEVLQKYQNVALIKCNLETGRTHQIRVHLKYLGHPLFGDTVYGGDKILRGNVTGPYKAFVENCFALLPRQALHAKSLGFIHPRTGKFIQFDSELPADFQAVIRKWENYFSNH
jgi:23S rRNA pseudouridine1911/1915/1917 synthase